VSQLTGTAIINGQTVQVTIDVPTARIPELPQKPHPVASADRIPIWDNLEDKSYWVDLLTARTYMITGGPGTPQAPVLNGDEVEIVVSSDMISNNGKRLNVPLLAGKQYSINERGYGVWLTHEYNILPSGGWDKTSTDPLDVFYIGEVFFARLYNLVATQPGQQTQTANFLNGIANITSSIQLTTVHYNKLLHVAGGSNKVTITLPDLADAPANTIIPIETMVSNVNQTIISGKSGQLIYFANTSQTSVILGQSSYIWLMKGSDGWYCMKASEDILNVGKPSLDNSVRLNTHLAIGEPANKADFPRLMRWLTANPSMLVTEDQWQNTKIDASLVEGVTDYVYTLRGKFADIDADTFRFPDYSDLAFVGLNNYGSTDADRVPNEVGVIQPDTIRAHTHKVGTTGNQSNTDPGRGLQRSSNPHDPYEYRGAGTVQAENYIDVTGASKTRMKNTGLIPLINI
jgi:hypothetical protein